MGLASYQRKRVPLPIGFWKNPIHLVATCCGVGAIPWFPGTFGTVLAVPFCYAIRHWPLSWYIALTIVLVVLGVWLCGKSNRDWGTDDHPALVWDEFASFFIVMTGLPKTWPWFLGGVILFRILDIGKPGPIGWLDRHVHGGLGVMLDDVVSALVSCLVLWLVWWGV